MSLALTIKVSCSKDVFFAVMTGLGGIYAAIKVVIGHRSAAEGVNRERRWLDGKNFTGIPTRV
jgi:hypothetical protein